MSDYDEEPGGFWPTPRQHTGTEFGGVERTKATLQPKPAGALKPSEILRLGYLTGEEGDTESLEDRRQMMGLRPADGSRPTWLRGTGKKSYVQLTGSDPEE